MKCLHALAVATLLFLTSFSAPPVLAKERVLDVFAASSLKDALDEIAETWSASDLRISLAGSSLLARQVAAGAPADVVILANSAWMDWLEGQSAIRGESRRDILSNRLVLMAPTTNAHSVDLTAEALSAELDGGRLAIALTSSVPAGLYGKEALQNLGLWDAVKDHLAETDNTRAALALVARAEVPLGLGYASDAAADPRVAIVAEFPGEAHGPIRYAAAATGPEGEDFLDFLVTPDAQAIFQAHGFVPLDRAP